MASACGGSGDAPGTGTPAKVAFFQDLSIEDSLDLVSPAFLALEAGLARAAATGAVVPEPVQFDTGGDPAAALSSARLVAGDPSYVAVVVAPFWTMPEDVAAALEEAGLPILSLSDGARPDVPGLVWRRFVAPAPAQARALAARAEASGGDPVCVVGDDTPRSDALAASVLRETGDRGVSRPEDVGACGAVVWTGGPSGAAALAVTLGDVPFLVGDAAKAAAYLDEAVPASDGTVAVCPCVDVTTATDLRARRFVNGYQAATGLAPGVFAAEGWDVAGVLADTGGLDRSAVRAAIGSLAGVSGVGGPIVFDDLGDPAGPAASATVTVAAGRRWLPTG